VEHEAAKAELDGLRFLQPLALPQEAVEQMKMLARFIAEWNEKVNLISRADIANIWTAHILHSLSPLFHYPLKSVREVLDLGTGGGFPGLPLAIARPEARFLLVDATGKKVKAVEDVAGRLGLHNVRTLHSRAEDLSRRPDCVHRFDLVTARAVAPLPDLIHWSMPLVRRRPPQGEGDPTLPALLAYKGGDIKQELVTSQTKYTSTKIRAVDLVFPPSAGLVGKRLVVVSL
jgi:16S rRNA (guanine527-N7)-methyltransferase